MESFLTKASSFLLARRAKQEFSSMGDDVNGASRSAAKLCASAVKFPSHKSLTEAQMLSYELLPVKGGDLKLSLSMTMCPFSKSLSNSVEEGAKRLFNRLRGKMQMPLPDLLQSYGLPRGLFPRNATHYELEEDTGKLTVFVPWICEVGYRDSSVVRYATKVTGTLSQGKLLNIEGLKTKILVWVKVSAISIEDSASKKVCFIASMKKARPFDAYDVMRDGIEVETF